MTEPPDGQWGGSSVSSNGSVIWNGMVAQLMDKSADICGASLTVTSERSKVIDFGIGLTEDSNSIFMLTKDIVGGSGGELNLMVYLTLFTKMAWFGILLLAATFAFQYAFVHYHIESSYKKMPFLNLFVAGWRHFTLVLMQRGQTLCHKGLALRFYGLVSCIVAFSVFTLYTADLTASMTVREKTETFKSLQEILESDFIVSVVGGTVNHDAFKLAKPGTVRHKVSETILKTIPTYDIYFDTKPDKEVYFGPFYVRLDDPEFTYVHNFEERIEGQLAFAFQKDSEIKEIFDYHVLKMKQSGVMKKLDNKWSHKSKPSDLSSHYFPQAAVNLGYENLFFPALIILFGIFSGLVVLLYEVLAKSKRWQVISRVSMENITTYQAWKGIGNSVP